MKLPLISQILKSVAAHTAHVSTENLCRFFFQSKRNELFTLRENTMKGFSQNKRWQIFGKR